MMIPETAKYHYVLTIQAKLENGSLSIGTFNGIAWGPDRATIFTERLTTHAADINKLPGECWVLCWVLEPNEL